MKHIVEEESGTYTGATRQHNGYYAGDFAGRPFPSPEPGDIRSSGSRGGLTRSP
jgi:hypothetical protein